MRIRIIPAVLLLVGFMGCDTTETIPTGNSAGDLTAASVKISLRSSDRKVSDSNKAGCKLPLAQATLEINNSLEREVTISPTDSIVRFDGVMVEAGNTRFDAYLLSNTAASLYQGGTNASIEEDGFEVSFPMTAAGPILQACPDELVTGQRGELEITNIGSDLLTWDVEPEGSLCDNVPCLSFHKTIIDSVRGSGTLEICGVNFARKDFDVSISSSVGSLSIPIDMDALDRTLPRCKPDLVVSRVEQLGDPVLNMNPLTQLVQAEWPIRVTLQNNSATRVGTFKVHAEYQEIPGGTFFVAAFTVPGQSDIWYPFTQDILLPGEEVSFEGRVIFHPSVRDTQIALRFLVDSCASEEFTLPWCRIDESDETNNFSALIQTQIP